MKKILIAINAGLTYSKVADERLADLIMLGMHI
jgi:hypothetical protein